MKKYFLLILIFTLLLSCKENNVGPTDNNSFSLELTVRNSNGNILPNINVSLWSNLKSTINLMKLSKTNKILSATNISYGIKQKCFVDLSIFNLDGQKINSLVSGQYGIGSYQVQVDFDNRNINGAYKVKLIASSDSLKNNILFKDSIYIVLWQPDPVSSFVGKTDSNGKLKITNKVLFPNLYNLPSMLITGTDSPTILGGFTFSDSVTVALSDESFSKSTTYEIVVKNGQNKQQLNWISTSSKFINTKLPLYKVGANVVINKISSSLVDWRLSQNYPNPFN